MALKKIDNSRQDYFSVKNILAFDSLKYSDIVLSLTNYVEDYKAIYCGMKGALQDEFKYDTIDYFKKLKEIQTATKFKVILEDSIKAITDFKGKGDLYLNYERELFSINNFRYAGKELINKFPNLPILNKDDKKGLGYYEGCVIYDSNFLLISLALTVLNNIYTNTFVQTKNRIVIDTNILVAYYLKGQIKALETWNNEFFLKVNEDPSEYFLNRLKHVYFHEDLRHLNECFDPAPYAKGCSCVRNLTYDFASLKGMEYLGYYSMLTSKIDEFTTEIGLLNKQLNIDNLPKATKTKEISEYFYLINSKTEFLEELKQVFQTEKGITFGILIKELEKNEVLKIGNREFKAFCESAQAHFDQNIGTRVAILKYKSENNGLYQKEIDSITSNLQPLILKYKTH